ncbi:MAG: phosphotransferase, partial [Bacteroidales bacterium]|nr:phosphotransferase [Bacteroidales bacterium]
MQQLISLYTAHTGKANPTLEALPSSGSNRRYYRLKSGGLSLIGVHGESRDENRAFIELSRHF